MAYLRAKEVYPDWYNLEYENKNGEYIHTGNLFVGFESAEKAAKLKEVVKSRQFFGKDLKVEEVE